MPSASDEDDQEILLEESQPESETTSATEHGHICRRLYTSHALSAWNSRVFEFGAFLFLAKIYSHTLLPASVYALARAASAALFSPWLGSYIDRADRLKAVRISIGMHILHRFLESRGLTLSSRPTFACGSIMRWLCGPPALSRLGSITNWERDCSLPSLVTGLAGEAKCSFEYHLSRKRLGSCRSRDR